MITPPVAFAAYAAANIAKTGTAGPPAGSHCVVGWSTSSCRSCSVLDAEPPDGRPELSDRVELRPHLGCAVRGRAVIGGYALTPLWPCRACYYGFVGAADRVPPDSFTGGHTIDLIGMRRRHRIPGVRSPAAAAQSAGRRTRLGVRIFLAPEAGAPPAPVGDRERHRLLLGIVGVFHPRRDDEHVLRPHSNILPAIWVEPSPSTARWCRRPPDNPCP